MVIVAKGIDVLLIRRNAMAPATYRQPRVTPREGMLLPAVTGVSPRDPLYY